MKAGKYILAIDQGTTGTTAMLLDKRLSIAGAADQEFPQHFPKPGWVEHDLNQIWACTETVVKKAIAAARARTTDIAAIGITNQRETTCVWHRGTLKPLHRAIVWQDRRTAPMCEALKVQGREPMVKERTGLVLDPYFSATKLRWLFDNVPGLREKAASGDLAFGTIDSFVAAKLTGGAVHVTDVTNASRTLLFDIHRLRWDPELCSLFDVPASCLPQVRASSEVYGTTKGVKGLPDGIPVAGIAGDQQAALVGQACFTPGEAKCTYGTGAFLLMNIGPKPIASRAGLLTTVAWQIGGEVAYALEGSAFVAGAAVQWLRDGLRIIKNSADVEVLARTVKSSQDVAFVPALAGLGAPHWRPDARGLFCGLDRGTTSGHMARAVLEGVAFEIYDLVQAMADDSGQKLPVFKVDGGASMNGLLMQFQADLLGVTVERPKMIETTALGAAFLAGLAVGFWKNKDDVRQSWKVGKRFAPRMQSDERARHIRKWQKAVARA